jgi:hypothetical protein
MPEGGYVMPKAEKEFVLNYAMNRWQLNFKKNVGPTSDSVRLCAPATLDEWRDYYYSNVKPAEHIDRLGQALYRHIRDELPSEKRFHPDLLAGISEQDCIAYIHTVVIDRVYHGYRKEHGD